jgi:hypothetical protein
VSLGTDTIKTIEMLELDDLLTEGLIAACLQETAN